MDDGLLARTEALRALRVATARRVAIVAAPEGFGKSMLVREWAAGLETFTAISIPASCTFDRFVSDALRRAVPPAPGLDRSLTTAFAKTVGRDDAPVALAGWFCRYLAGTPRTVLVDGADAALDERIVPFLRAAIAGSDADVRWILVGRDPAILVACAGDADIAKVPAEALRLSFPELRELARRSVARHTSGELFAIWQKARGSISRAVFLLRCMQFGVASVTSAQTSFESLVERCFADLSETERLETMAGVLLEDGGDVEDGELARNISSVFSRLRTTAPFLFEPSGRRLQACVRERLSREIRMLLADDRTGLFVRAGDALEASGQTASAIALYCAAGDLDRLLAVVERRGGIGLEGEAVHVLREAIALIPEEIRDRHGLVVGLRAVDARNRGRSDEAAALFERALALCDRGAHENSVRYWYAGLGINLGDSRLVQRTLRPSVEFFASPPALRAAMMALLGASWAMSGERERARRWIGRARRIADAGGDEALAARVYQQAAFVALHGDDLDEARDLGERAVGYAEACGWPHVAAITYGILHHVALRQERFDAAGQCAGKLAEHAARAGNVALHYAAVAACFEYETERCDLLGIAKFGAELTRFEAAATPALFGERHIERAARALQAAWDGRFAHAFRIVEPIVAAFEAAASGAGDELGILPERGVLALAALYAAAAGLRGEAERVLALSRRFAGPQKPSEALVRARVAECLALSVLGRRGEAGLILRGIRAGLPSNRTRSHVYAELARSVLDSTECATGPGDVSLEEEMYANGWGGLARLARSVLAGSRIALAPGSRKSRAFG